MLQYAKRAGNFANVWNANVSVPGNDSIVGMVQVCGLLTLILQDQALTNFFDNSRAS